MDSHPPSPLEETDDVGALAPIFRRQTALERAKARDEKVRECQTRVNSDRALLQMLNHASTCTKSSRLCPIRGCADFRMLWQHARSCRDPECEVHPRCVEARRVLEHHAKCRKRTCPTCAPAETLSMLYHASLCKKKVCEVAHCVEFRMLWQHARACPGSDGRCCAHPMCAGVRRLLGHHRRCGDPNCVICEPVVTECKRLFEARRRLRRTDELAS